MNLLERTALLIAMLAPLPGWPGPGAPSAPAVKGDDSCPMLLFEVSAGGKIIEGKELVRGADCGWPDVFHDGELHRRSVRPSLAERTQFATVVLSCDHLFRSESQEMELSPWIQASPLQLGVPPKFRIKTRLMDYLGNLAAKDRGVWVFGRGKEGAGARPSVVGCRPREWRPYPAPVSARVSTSKLVVTRPSKSLEVPDYPLPDEGDAKGPTGYSVENVGESGGESGIPLPPTQLEYPGRR